MFPVPQVAAGYSGKNEGESRWKSASERWRLGCIGVLGCCASLDGDGVALTVVPSVLVSNAAANRMVA